MLKNSDTAPVAFGPSAVSMAAPGRTWSLVLDAGTEVMSALERFVRAQRIGAGRFTGTGAMSVVVLGCFRSAERRWTPMPLHEQVEVLSLAGEIDCEDGVPDIRACRTYARG